MVDDQECSPVNVVGSKSNTLYPVQHWAQGGSRIEDELFVAVEFEVYGQGTNKNAEICTSIHFKRWKS